MKLPGEQREKPMVCKDVWKGLNHQLVGIILGIRLVLVMVMAVFDVNPKLHSPQNFLCSLHIPGPSRSSAVSLPRRKPEVASVAHSERRDTPRRQPKRSVFRIWFSSHFYLKWFLFFSLLWV